MSTEETPAAPVPAGSVEDDTQQNANGRTRGQNRRGSGGGGRGGKGRGGRGRGSPSGATDGTGAGEGENDSTVVASGDADGIPKGRGAGAGGRPRPRRGGGGAGRGGRGSGSATPRLQGACKVSADSDIQKVSGYIAAGIRSDQPATVLAISDLAVNKSIKALALARNFLSTDTLDLVAQPEFPEFDENPHTANMQLTLQAKQTRIKLDDKVAATMVVSQRSQPNAVAGAIASTAREGKHVTRVSGMGPQAVLRTVKSIFLARRYLAKDALDLSFVPEFSDSDNGLTVMNFYVLAHAPRHATAAAVAPVPVATLPVAAPTTAEVAGPLVEPQDPPLMPCQE